MLAVALIRRADRGRYAKLMTDLKDQYTLKSDVYPSDITSIHNMLENYSSKPNPRKNQNDQQNIEGLQFAQRNGPVPGKDGKTFVHIQRCNVRHTNNCRTSQREQNQDTLLFLL